MNLISKVLILLQFINSDLFLCKNFEEEKAFDVRKALACSSLNLRSIKHGYCDVYFECKNDTAEEKICPRGLVYNHDSGASQYPCDYPNLINCKGKFSYYNESAPKRTRSNMLCKQPWGMIKAPVKDCGVYINCVAGRPIRMRCSEKLAFNPANYQCDHPDLVDDCNVEEFLGFSCPHNAMENEKFPVHDNCVEYFICINKKPRYGKCGNGTIFDNDISGCRKSSNPSECNQKKTTMILDDLDSFLDDKAARPTLVGSRKNIELVD